MPLTPISHKSSKFVQQKIVHTSQQKPQPVSRSKSFEEHTEQARYHPPAPEYKLNEESETDEYKHESIKALAERFGPVSPVHTPKWQTTFQQQPEASKDDLYMNFGPDKYRTQFEYNVTQKGGPPQKSFMEFPEQEFLISHSPGKLRLSEKRVDKFGNELPAWARQEDEGPIIEEPVSPRKVPPPHFDSKQPGPELLKKLPPVLRKPEGQQVRFEIEVDGSLPPQSIQVSWFKDGMHVRNSPDTRLASNFGLHTLIIPEVFYEDSGLYKVLVQTPLGNLESFCQLVVEGC